MSDFKACLLSLFCLTALPMLSAQEELLEEPEADYVLQQEEEDVEAYFDYSSEQTECVEEDDFDLIGMQEQEIAMDLDEVPIYSEDVEVDPPFDKYTPAPPPPPPISTTPEQLTIDLKNPTFVQGVIRTDEGGIVSAPGLRIQAKHIEYTNKIENGVRVQKIVAEGDLMMDYADRAFVGSRLEYDFIHRTGTLWDGKTFVDMWFLGGDKIDLKEDGTFYIYNAFVTTSESQDNTWEINAKKVKITEDYLLSARNIRFRFFKVPLFWLPSFKSNLKAFTDPPIRYKVVWDKGLGPRLTMRYRVFSWRDLNLFFRLDYRLKRGFGGALESEYFSPDGLTTFVTRSYGAHDKSFPYETGPHRYRLQGLYHTQSKDERTQVHITYDKLSDNRMVGDFKSDDFEINTQRRTQLLIYHQLDNMFANCRVQPRINRFQSIDQELPLISLGVRPFQIGNSGILSSNYVNAGYLDYVYANELRDKFHELGLSSSTHSLRLETRNNLYRPFHWGPITFTPGAGFYGVFYGRSPEHHATGQAILTYTGTLQTHLTRHYDHFKHIVEPYMRFEGLTNPTSGVNDHFYFDITDGVTQLNQLRIGFRNTFFSPKQSLFGPSLMADVYTYGFFNKRKFAQSFPKFYTDIEWSRPSYAVRSGIAWNNEETLWDYVNIATDWTINADFAFGVEFRHRSKYDWRKANHQNFFLDIARPIPQLLDSPLSDGRDTFLTRFFFRLAPKLTCHIQTRHGWGRNDEPRYNAGKVDLFHMLTCSWRLRLSYERIPGDNRFSGAVSLVK
ncbi:MAG: LPS-assembly protein LptD [Verrucomicrobia bacterium]|nr:LPS-assembly protein LptD [Verrucomicrobiota bacterium]